MTKKPDTVTEDDQSFNDFSPPNSSNFGTPSWAAELSHVIQNFDKMTTEEVDPMATTKSTLPKDLSKKELVNEVAEFVSKITNEGREPKLRKQHIIDYIGKK